MYVHICKNNQEIDRLFINKPTDVKREIKELKEKYGNDIRIAVNNDINFKFDSKDQS